MVCTSTRASPELPSAALTVADAAELQARCAALELENRKLRRINTALIESARPPAGKTQESHSHPKLVSDTAATAPEPTTKAAAAPLPNPVAIGYS